jgi:hypothetical protein
LNLANKIEEALMLAGWQEQLPPSSGTTFNRGGGLPIGIRTNAGIWVMYPQQSGEPFKSAAEALSHALIEKGLIAPLHVITGKEQYDLDKIHVWAGEKPQIP